MMGSRRLSHATRAALLGFLVAAPIVMAIVAPLRSLVPLVMVYVPPGLFVFAVVRYNSTHTKSSNDSEVDVNALVHYFTAGCFPGVLVAMLVEVVLTLVGLGLFLALDNGDVLGQIEQYRADHPGNDTSAGDILAHVHIRHSSSVLLTLAFMAFVVAGTVEESIKAWLALRSPCQPCWSIASGHPSDSSDVALEPSSPSSNPGVRGGRRPLTLVMSFAAVGCGFATMENASYTFLAPSFRMQLWTAAVRGMLATPLHMTCACLSAMHLVLQHQTSPLHTRTRSDVVRALVPAMLLHGVYDLQAFLFAFWLEFEDDSVVSFGASVLCLVVGGLYLNYLRGRIQWNDDYLVVPNGEDRVGVGGTSAGTMLV